MYETDFDGLRKGDLSQFEGLYETFVRKIYDFLFYKTFDKELAEDLTQETFLKALKKIDSFHGASKGEFSSWIYTIAYNNYIDYLRTNKQIQEMDENTEEFSYVEKFGVNIDNNDKVDEIMTFLDYLGKANKDIVIMRLWDGLSYKEISEITGKSVDNCKKIVSRTISQIQSNIALMLLIHFISFN
ncbi:MAG: RNA polymerase sigma factor [Candidatus Gracilibacteria bacterium]|nr:RNA polymerase sigma factor [Candidatus Gracilibacteria bacterium]